MKLFHVLTIALVAAAMLLTSCSTTYFGPRGYVAADSPTKAKSTEQRSSVTGENGVVVPTFDEEFVYDDKGNIIKEKQTEYVDPSSADKKFILWETEYKSFGGMIVPATISVNGVVFVEIEWDLLTTKHDGPVTQDLTRSFSRYYQNLLLGNTFGSWRVDLDRYPVAFRSDNKLVKQIQRVIGGYIDTDNYLTLGYGNIVLKRFSYSYEKLSMGVAKTYASFAGYGYASGILEQMNKGNSVEFSYTWQQIGDKICQTSANYKSKIGEVNIDFKAEVEYNASGDRTKETWLLADENSVGKSEKPLKIFEQVLKY